jgi:hypothetical protein
VVQKIEDTGMHPSANGPEQLEEIRQLDRLEEDLPTTVTVGDAYTIHLLCMQCNAVT